MPFAVTGPGAGFACAQGGNHPHRGRDQLVLGRDIGMALGAVLLVLIGKRRPHDEDAHTIITCLLSTLPRTRPTGFAWFMISTGAFLDPAQGQRS